MKRLLPFFTGLWLLLMASSSSAAYITDKLLAGLYENPDPEENPIQVLSSGTPLELIETRGDFTLVRLTDRTEGWVETLLISDEKPAQVMLLELQASMGELRSKLQKTEADLKQAEAATPEEERLEKELAFSSQRIEELTENLETARSELAKGDSILDLPIWLLPAGALLILLGFIGGIVFRNYRLRKRLGGLRL